MDSLALIVGTGSSALGAEVARELRTVPAACEIRRFPDGEISVSLREAIRDRDVFLLQSTSPPVNEHLIELLALTDACRRACAARVIAVVPYFGYARSDKRHHRCEPIMASAVAHLLHGAGVDHLVTVDLHSAQIEGFFRIPVDALAAAPVLCDALRDRLPADTVVVSPDEGRVKTATLFGRLLGAPVALVHKERASGMETHVVKVVGDVRQRACLIIDDMISTGGTIAGAVDALLAAGARPEIFVAATHGLLLPGALEKLDHEAVREVIVTDTLTIQHASSRVRVTSVAPLLAETIRRISPREDHEGTGMQKS